MILNNAIVTVGFASLVSEMGLVFGVASIYVVMLITLPSIEYVPLSFVIAWLFNNMKTNYVVYIGSIVQLIGCWLRMLSFIDHSHSNIAPLYVGTAIFVMATPMSLNGIS